MLIGFILGEKILAVFYKSFSSINLFYLVDGFILVKFIYFVIWRLKTDLDKLIFCLLNSFSFLEVGWCILERKCYLVFKLESYTRCYPFFRSREGWSFILKLYLLDFFLIHFNENLASCFSIDSETCLNGVADDPWDWLGGQHVENRQK